jgi:hypothetical protein
MEGEMKLTGHSAGAACPTCGKAEVFEHPDGQLRHCFSCGVDFTSVMPRGVEEVVEDIFKASRQHLSDSDEARKYLVEQRGLDPQVLSDSALGLLPADLDITQLFLAKLEKVEAERTRVLAAPRKAGRPTKKEQEAIDDAMGAVERLNKTREEFAEFFEGRGGWLLFAYTDKAHRKVRIRLWSPETDERAEMSFGLTSGVFNHALFAPSGRVKSLEPLQGRSIIVASEFDVLQLQSVGARLAQVEGPVI